ncbi:hypothetical protein [Candidatus Flexifilum breve]|uniref:ABC transporter permease subunit n=1 Tax=Candidatus Flexifilum breve TaxID=3140694 RepID=UPI0031CCD210
MQFPDQPILIAALSVGTGIAVGFLWGVVQGYIIAYLRVTAFIVTLGSSWLLNGLILLVTEGRTIPADQPTFAQIAQGYLPNEIGWIIAVITIILLFYGAISGRRRKRRYDFELPPMALDIAKTVGFSVLVVGYVYMVNQCHRGIQAPVLPAGARRAGRRLCVEQYALDATPTPLAAIDRRRSSPASTSGATSSRSSC